MTEEEYQDIFLGSLTLWTLLSLLFQYLVDRALEALEAFPFRTADTLTALYILLTSLPSPLSFIPPQTPPPIIHVLLGTILAVAGCAGVGLVCVSWQVVNFVHKSCHPLVDPLPIETPSPPSPPLPPSTPPPDPPADVRQTSRLRPDYKLLPPPTLEEREENRRLCRIEHQEMLLWLVEYTWLTSYASVLKNADTERYWVAIVKLEDWRDDRRDLLTWSHCHFDWKRHLNTLESIQSGGEYDWAITAIEQDRLATASESIEAWRAKWTLPELPQVPVTHQRRKLPPSLDDNLRRSSVTPILTSAVTNIQPTNDARAASPPQTNISASVASIDAATIPHLTPSITPASSPLKSANISEVVLPILSSPVEPVSTTQEPTVDDASPTSSQQADPVERQKQQDSVCASSATVVSAPPLPSSPTIPVELKSSTDDTPSTPVSKYEVILPLPGLWASMHSPINRLRNSPNTPSTPAPRSTPQAESDHTSSDDEPSTPRNVESLSSVPSPSCECPLNHTHRGCGPLPSLIPDDLLSYSPNFADDSDCSDDERVPSLEVASDAGYESDAEFNVRADGLCELLDAVSIEMVVDAPVLPSQEPPNPFVDTTSYPEEDFAIPQQPADFASQTIAPSVQNTPSAPSSPSPAYGVPDDEVSLVLLPHVDSTMVLLQRSEEVSMDAEVNENVELASPIVIAASTPQHTASVNPSSSVEVMETQGDDDDEDLEEVECNVRSTGPFGDADMESDDDEDEGDMEEDVVVPDMVPLSEAQPDTGMADGEADADGISDDGLWEEGSSTVPQARIATNFEFNVDVPVPMEAPMPSASSWGYTFEVEQPYASTSQAMQLSLVADANEGNDMLQMVPLSTVGMEDSQPLPFSDYFMPTTSDAGSSNAYLSSIPASEATMEGNGAGQDTTIAPFTAQVAPQDEPSHFVELFDFLQAMMGMPTSGVALTFNPAQLLNMSAPSEPAVGTTGDLTTFLPHGMSEPPMSPPAPPSDFPFDLTFLNEAPTTVPKTPAQLMAFATPAFELATGLISLEEILGSPNTHLDGDHLGRSEDDFGAALNYDGGGAWASSDEEASEATVPIDDGNPTEEEHGSPSETHMSPPSSAPSTQDVPVDQRQVRGLPRRARKSTVPFQFRSATAPPPPVQPQPQPSSTIGHFAPATASAALELVSGSARVIKKVPKRFAERAELVCKADALVDGPTTVTSDATMAAPPLEMVLAPPAPTASSKSKRTVDSETSAVSPAHTPLAQTPFSFNFGAKAAAPTTVPGPPSFTFIPFTVSESSVLATEEATPRVFRALPRARGRVSAASLVPAQGTNESGMTEAELRESFSREDRLEARGRDEDRVRESDSESEYSEGQDDYVINEED